ncbi:hypothetical protein [Paenibacillus protaetiae]|uniref:Uncharacterized protein n=1 Tax=Paenibacillus protaetiae TaxID=2509456 RepID=A0A4P6F0Q1_9BACL|nr:hypothetical protein [Paenibacillus protaetiae]QAY67679.1 hypothetical protein ET464_16120 [Paenibacillus protaetiae]
MNMPDKTAYYRATKRVLLLAAICALGSGALLKGAQWSTLILDESRTIACLLLLAYAVPVARLFRGQYWYFALFIPLLWLPLLVLASALALALPPAGQSDGLAEGVLLVYISVLNAFSVAGAVVLGLAARAAIAAARTAERMRTRRKDG